MKTCTRCGASKRANGFYTNKRTKDGLRSECKNCSKDMTKLLRMKKKGLNVEEKIYDKVVVNILDDVIEGLQNLRSKMVA